MVDDDLVGIQKTTRECSVFYVFALPKTQKEIMEQQIKKNEGLVQVTLSTGTIGQVQEQFEARQA
jgi:hypothetical protein